LSRRRQKEKKTYRYECTLTGEKYTLTEKITNTDELVSVAAYYEMHPDEDDRPMLVKKKLGLLDEDVKVEKEDEEETEAVVES
jgi:DNA-directed RNA polymerase subunit L